MNHCSPDIFWVDSHYSYDAICTVTKLFKSFPQYFVDAPLSSDYSLKSSWV